MLASLLQQLYFDIPRGRHPGLELVCRLVERICADDLAALAEAVDDPLAFVPLLRAAIGTPAERRMTALAQDRLDQLGLDILRPADVINSPAPNGGRCCPRLRVATQSPSPRGLRQGPPFFKLGVPGYPDAWLPS